jgi:hypothetical protein
MAYSGVGLELMSRDNLPPEISSLAELEQLVRDQKEAFLYVRSPILAIVLLFSGANRPFPSQSTIAMLALLVYDYLITL